MSECVEMCVKGKGMENTSPRVKISQIRTLKGVLGLHQRVGGREGGLPPSSVSFPVFPPAVQPESRSFIGISCKRLEPTAAKLSRHSIHQPIRTQIVRVS